MPANQSDYIHGVSFRPKIYITLDVAKGTVNKDGTTTYYDANGDVTDTAEYKTIGAIQDLTINSTRDVNVWRELNYAYAGKPIESYPGLPTYELELGRIVLYDKDDGSGGNYLEAFGFEGHDIIKQNRPLTIRVTMKSPDGGSDKVMIVYGVWFKENPMEFSVDDVSDLRILQSVTAVAAGITG